jgi:hypothetical protein
MAAEVQIEKPKYTRKKCEHGRQACQCVDCGTGVCIHKKIKSMCVECGSSGICIHKKHKSRCVECKGASICPHSKRRSRCIECNGGSICIHKQIKGRCAECGGADLCIHKKRKDHCTECAESECICEHKKRKSRCADCQGTEICSHGNSKYCCVKCDSNNICEHKKLKNQCVECDGIHVCEHKKRRSSCIICTPESGCQHCNHVSIIGSRWKPYCFRCYCVLNPDVKIPRQFKLKEHYVMDALKAHYKDTLTMAFDKTIEGGCSKKRPDLFIDFGSHCLIIEVDENRHANYACEQKRMISLYEDLGFRKVIFLRFNPDGYTEQSIKHISPFGYTPTGMIKINTEEMSRRIEILITKLEECREEPEDILTTLYLFYG